MYMSAIELHVLKIYIKAFLDCLTSSDFKELAYLSDRARNDDDLHKLSRDILASIVSYFENNE